MSLYPHTRPDLNDVAAATPEGGVHLSLTGRLVYPHDDRVLRFLREGWFEYRELATMSRLIRPGDCFVDIGAHCALYSKLAFRRMSTNGTIVVVEPNPALHAFIRKNIEIDTLVTDEPISAGTISLVNAAVASSNGDSILHTHNDGWTAYSTLQPVEGKHDAQSIPVRTRSLDSLIPEANDDRQIIVKMDAEGLEYDILFQAHAFLRDRDDIHLMIEFDQNNLAMGGYTTADLYDLVRDAGYTLAELNSKTFRLQPFESREALWGANLIATKNLDLLNHRLASAEEDVALETEDFLRKGEAAARIYDGNEELSKVLDAARRITGRIVETTASLESAPEARSSNDGSEAGKTPAETIALLDDRLAQLTGAAQGLLQQLGASRQAVAARDELLLRISGKLADHTRVVAESVIELSGNTEQMTALDEALSALEELPAADRLERLSTLAADRSGMLAGAARWLTDQLEAAQRELGTQEELLASASGALAEHARAVIASAAEVASDDGMLKASLAAVEALPVSDRLEQLAALASDSTSKLTGAVRALSERLSASQRELVERNELLARADAALTEHTRTVTADAAEFSSEAEKPSAFDTAVSVLDDLPLTDKLEQLIALASNRSTKLAGAARWLSNELSRLQLEAYGPLRSNANEARLAIESARHDLAKLIADTAMKSSARSEPADDFLSEALRLEQQIKERLARAAWCLSTGLSQLAAIDPAPETDASGDEDPAADLARAQTLNRSLFAEIHRLGVLLDRTRQSRWLRLGERIGANAVRQLDMAGALIEEIEKRPSFPEAAAAPDRAQQAKA